MLSRADLQSFQAHQSYPAVSILAPTHRTAPANKQDPIKVKNLVSKAVKRLEDEFSKREVKGIVKALQGLVRDVDWQHTLDGLALFASQEQAASINLPFKVAPRVTIDETFATRDLVYALNRAEPYRVLALGHSTRLFDGWTTVLEEHLAKPFPVAHKGRGGALLLPGRFGVNRSAQRDHAHREYFRIVDEAFGAVNKARPLPLVVAGVERNLAFFREVTRHADAIVGLLAGNHEESAPDKLGKLAWPVFEIGATQRRTEALVQLDDAVSANRNSSGIAQVWRAAAARKVRTLFVEKQYKYPTDVAEDGQRLTPYSGQGPGSFDDAVDEIVERVLAAGGEVQFYAPGDLCEHQRIAAILKR